MLMKYFTKLSLVTSFGLILLLSASYASFAQKDHGNDNGKRNDGGKHGENRSDEGRGNGGGKHERRQEEAQTYRQGDNRARDEGANRGRGNGNWKNERREERQTYNVPSPQQVPRGGGWIPPGQIRNQQVHERNAERKAIKDQEKAYRRVYRDQENESRREAPRYDQRYSAPQWFDQARRVVRNGYTNPDQRWYDANRRSYRQSVTVNPYGPGAGYYPQTNGYYADPNDYRYNQNQTYYGYGQDPYSNSYGQYPSGIKNGTSWKNTILRTIISSILGGIGGQDNNYYDPNAYNVNYANGSVRYAQPAFNTGGYPPQYAGLNPAYSQYAGYEQPQYDNSSPYSGGILNSIPLTGLFGQRSGAGGYVAQILSQVLAQGYLQGLLAGRTARQSGSGNRYYNDPYVSADGVYDPYSYTIGENRRVLSEGFGLGFEDALGGRNQYDQPSAGNVDLVSLLLNNVFRLG